MDGEQWLASYQGRLQDIRARATRAQAALAGIEGTASSRDGAVTATVDPSGTLRRLVLSERTETMTRVQLAAAVVATAAQAQGAAARQATEAIAPLIGTDSAAMRALRSRLPAESGTP